LEIERQAEQLAPTRCEGTVEAGQVLNPPSSFRYRPAKQAGLSPNITRNVTMPITIEQAADFAIYARRPETWAIAARRQLAVAQHLFAHEESLRSAQRSMFDERSGSHYAACLHAGLAVENAAKAALVARDPTVITNRGTIDKAKFGLGGGHGLRSIAQSVLSSLSRDEQMLLDKLQEYVVWAGRYTIPMNAEVLFDEERMDTIRVASLCEQNSIRQLVTRLLLQAGVTV
jgi:hypothetical protein